MILKKNYHFLLLLILFSLFYENSSAQIEIVTSDSISIENVLAVCAGEELQMTLMGVSEDQVDSVYWNFGNSDAVSVGLTINHIYAEPGDFQIWVGVLYTDDSFIDSLATRSISISALPDASFAMNNMDATLVNSTVSFINQSAGAENYYWLF